MSYVGVNDEIQPLTGERYADESDAAVLACNDYLRLGPGRKAIILGQYYINLKGQIPPTRSYNTLQSWHRRFKWVERAGQYDLQYDEYKTAMAEAAIETGIALMWERVNRLKQLEETLLDLIYGSDITGQASKLMLKDYKQTGSGDTAEVHEIERFNSALIDQYRKILDDVAQETGARRKASAQGTEEDPIVVKTYKGVSMEDL